MERKEVEIKLFGVSHDGDLMREYPDLAKIDEFKDLDPKQVKFCWLVGNRTSPIFKLERGERIKRAFQIVWGSNYMKIPTIKSLTEAGSADEFPSEILKAIHKMNTFSPTYRLKAKLMDEYIFETLNELIVVSPSELGAMDVDDKKKYADLAMKVSAGLGEMVERIESSYGVKVIERKTKKQIQVNINDLMH